MLSQSFWGKWHFTSKGSICRTRNDINRFFIIYFLYVFIIFEVPKTFIKVRNQKIRKSVTYDFIIANIPTSFFTFIFVFGAPNLKDT